MSYIWQDFNIKTFEAETVVFRDGVFCPELSTLESPEISSNYDLPIHFIYVGNGDSILLESNCHYGLVDTGNPYKDGTPQALTDSIYTGIHVKNYLKSIGVKHLDFINSILQIKRHGNLKKVFILGLS